MKYRWTIISLSVFVLVAVGLYGYQSGWFSKPEQQPTISTPSPTPLGPDTWQLEISIAESPLPLIFSDSLSNARIQELLKDGAVVLPVGKSFGQPGNKVITAHSSGYQSFGPYRFAFTKLNELKEGDTFAINGPEGKFTYRIYKKEVVGPSEVDKLPKDDRSTVTLVTCWPIWTSAQRLLVDGELVQ